MGKPSDDGRTTTSPQNGKKGGMDEQTLTVQEFREQRERITALIPQAEQLLTEGRSAFDAVIVLEVDSSRAEAESAVEAAADIIERRAESAAQIVPPAFLENGCELYTFNDLLDYKPDKANYIAGDGFIRRGAATLLTGGTGLGKSVLTAQLTVAVASGINFLDCIKIRQPERVLHIQAENDVETMQRDFCSCVKHMGADPGLVHENLTMCHAYGITGLEFCEWLAEIVPYKAPTMVVIDPYQSFAGSGDMNCTAGFLEWHRPIQAIIQQHNIALVLVAHTPKPRDRDNWGVRDSVYMAAGTSALANWVRASMELMAVGKEVDRFTLRFGKNAERVGLVDEDTGRVVREMFVTHSGNRHEPFWNICDNQAAPNNSKFSEKILELALSEPHLTHREIGLRLGCSIGTVNKHYPKGVE